MKRIVTLLLMLVGVDAMAQPALNVIPMPVEIKMGKGNLVMKQPLGFIINADIEPGDGGVALFKAFLKKQYGFKKFVDGDTHSYGLPTEIFLNLSVDEPENEGYEIKITSLNITISATAKGMAYAFETLKQKKKKNGKKQVVLPVCTIKDAPRFKYRGMHLDVCRHFMPVSFVKKYIDYLAAYKFNTFHWHLTDDQGWRIEIKKYPKLTTVGGFRNGTITGKKPGESNDSLVYGGFYTQQQIKEVVRYAAERYITIIPEIEMPGHASAAIAAYPQLSCFPDEDTQFPTNITWAGSTTGKQVQQTWGVFPDVFCPSEYTFNFLQDVLDEVMPLFPSKYIHIGGDECPKDNWKRSDFCQQLIKEKSLKDEHGLQSYFVQRIEQYINKKGKKIIGWDEILEGGLAPNATVMSWRGEEGGIEAAKQNHDVIMTPESYCYFDHSQSKNEDSLTIGGYVPLDKVYNYDPVPATLSAQQAKHILGAQANVWTEYINYPSKVAYAIFPRIAALSEVLWTPRAKKSWKDFERRLPVLFERLNKEKISYSKAYYDLATTVLPTEDFSGVTWKVTTNTPNSFVHIIDGYRGFGLYDSVPVFDVYGNKKGYKKITRPVDINASTAQYVVKGNSKSFASQMDFDHNYLVAEALDKKTKKQLSTAWATFHFNKATGKKITLTVTPSAKYPGDGGFTLVNGIQNWAGLAHSEEFLGFNGTNCSGTIELGEAVQITKITFHLLGQTNSWIHLPKYISVKYTNSNGEEKTVLADNASDSTGNVTYTVELKEELASFNFEISNHGIIEAGYPGEGSPSWLFVDEIEVD